MRRINRCNTYTRKSRLLCHTITYQRTLPAVVAPVCMPLFPDIDNACNSGQREWHVAPTYPQHLASDFLGTCMHTSGHLLNPLATVILHQGWHAARTDTTFICHLSEKIRIYNEVNASTLTTFKCGLITCISNTQSYVKFLSGVTVVLCFAMPLRCRGSRPPPPPPPLLSSEGAVLHASTSSFRHSMVIVCMSLQ